MIWALGYDATINGQELIESIGENYLDMPLNNTIQLPNQLLIKSYPNPFNSTCVIEFDLIKNQYLNIDIYSIRGQFIDRLYSGLREKGMNRYTFDINKMSGKISSGIFFISVNGEKMNNFKKIIYLK